MMKELHLRYAGPVTAITQILDERYETHSDTLRGLLDELNAKYGGFHEMFMDKEKGRLCLNIMIYYHELGKSPCPMMDLDQIIRDHSTLFFW